MRFLIAFVFVALGCGVAHAQNRVVLPGGCGTASYTGGVNTPTMNTAGQDCAAVASSPSGATSTAVGGTITAGNTFQSALAASSTRKGCTIQNTSSHTLYVFFGATASATTANSFQVAPGATIMCSTQTGAALTDNVAVTTSTTGDTFVVNSQ